MPSPDVYFGQCFLCGRTTTLRLATNEKGVPVYKCPHCCGANSALRVEARKDVHNHVVKGFGPRKEAV